MIIFKQKNFKRNYECTNIVAIQADVRPEGLHHDFIENSDPRALDGLTQIDLTTMNGVTVRRFGHL